MLEFLVVKVHDRPGVLLEEVNTLLLWNSFQLVSTSHACFKICANLRVFREIGNLCIFL